MSQLDLDERELAAGAAVAMDMARQYRRENKLDQKTALSASSIGVTVAFVVISSVGMLVLMMVYSG